MFTLSRVSLQHPDSIWSPRRTESDGKKWVDPFSHNKTRSSGALVYDTDLYDDLCKACVTSDLKTIALKSGLTYTQLYRYKRGNGERAITADTAKDLRTALKDLLALK